jgi:outer membrane protein insertion porin family
VSLGYGDSYGKTKSARCLIFGNDGNPVQTTETVACGLPFYKNFYAGGPGSVRGFTANTLGPTTNYGGYSRPQPLGGAIKTTGTFEFFFPRLISGPGTRLSAFVDYGNVFQRPGDFALDEFRVTTGLALQWQSPMGPISISYALPLRKEDSDDIERLQFTFGNQR